ncbi:MAG: chorismate synthase [Planctomycetia bacterium]|nr:chorismate synthase [Planctomycetia bacterium]
MLIYHTTGESHGRGLSALVDGFPGGVPLDIDFINTELRRRQGGYGRGGRQKLETDTVEILSGILHGESTGSPLLLWVVNRDYKIESMPELHYPRPGHGDLTGSRKYLSGIRPILERSSARETAARVAAGALARLFLRALDIEVAGYVQSIGPLDLNSDPDEIESLSPADLIERRDLSSVYSLFPEKDAEAEDLIDRCREAGDTLGGILEVRVFNVPFGLGTHAQWDRKLDARLALAAMSIQAIKGVEIGLGFDAARRYGSQVHDPILFDPDQKENRTMGYIRPSNNAGGIEAGMSNGQPIIVRAAMKPIATLKKPLASIDLRTGKPYEASYERSDVCAISAASVVLENVVAFEIASAIVEKFGGDSLKEIAARLDLFQKMNQSEN